MHPWLSIASEAAYAAGRYLTRQFDHPPSSASTHSLPEWITEIDQSSEKIIINHIRKAFPKHRILAEESGLHPGGEDVTWIVDPLDGSYNYLRNIPFFSISIAIQVGTQVLHGVVYDPLRDELFMASQGRGSKCNQTRLRVSQYHRIQDAVIADSHHSPTDHHEIDYKSCLFGYTDGFHSVRRLGSAALELCYLAAGRIDVFCGSYLHQWDTAAAMVIVREAGGLYAGLDEKIDPNHAPLLLSANPKLFPLVKQRILSTLADNIVE